MSSSEKPDQIQASVAAALSRLRGDVPSGATSDEPQAEERPRPANDVRGDPFFRTIQSSPQGARAPIPMTPFPRMQAPQEPTESGSPSEEESAPTSEPNAAIEIPEMPERRLAPDLIAMPQPRAATSESSQPAPMAATPMEPAVTQAPGISSNNPFARVLRGATPPAASDPVQRDLLTELPPPISEPLSSSDTDLDASDQRRRRRNRRLLAMAAVIIVIVVGAWLWKGGAPSTEVPVIAADATPEKVKPADEGGLQVQNQDVQVLDPSTQTQGETVMPEPEQPMTPPAATAPGDATSSEQAPAVVENAAPQTSPTVTSQAPVVEAPEAQAPAVDAPPAPETPLSSVPLPSMEENSGANAAPTAPTATAPQPTQTAETPAVAEQAPAPTPTATEPAASPAPAPEPAQATQPEQTAAQPAQTQEAAVAPTVPAGSVRIQLAAGKSEASVQKEWAALQKAHPNLLGSLGLNIEKVDKGSAGIFYRLQAGPLADKAAARKLCASLKQQNQDCIVVAK